MMPGVLTAIKGAINRKPTVCELERSRIEDVAVLGIVGGVSVLAACVAPVLSFQRFHGSTPTKD